MSSPIRQSAGDAAQTRVLNDEDPMLQAALEQLAVTYSIRTILLWTLVIVPTALAIIGVILAFVLHTPVDSGDVASVPDRP
jgi:hypothetical protein